MKFLMCNLSKSSFKQKGWVAIKFLLMLPFMLGMIALALDAGQLFIVKTELQNATDACAISAGGELNSLPEQFNSAQAAGILAGVAHYEGLQKTVVTMTNNNAVTFAKNLNDSASSYITASAGSALSRVNSAPYKYVKCTATRVVNKLLKVPGLEVSDTLSAQAIASRVPAKSPCVLPIGMCSNANAVTSNTVGAWISGEVGKSNPCVGNADCYKWVVYNGATPNASNLAGILTGNNVCGIDVSGQSVTEFSGAAASPFDEYNTRFGVQKGSNTVNPDFTGFGYVPSNYAPAAAYTSANSLFAINAYSNYVTQKSALNRYQGTPNLAGYTIVQPTVSNAKSRRVGIVPIIPCNGGTSNVSKWACVLMLNPIASGGTNKTLYLEYLGSASAGACSQIGIAGGGGGGNGPTVSVLVQ